MGLELILTELWPFKLTHVGSFLHCMVWSLRNQILLQLSMNENQTLHTHIMDILKI